MVVCNKVKCEMKFAKDERGEVRNSRGKGRLLEEEERAQDFRVFSDEKRVLGPWISFASLVLSLGQLPTTSPGPKMEATTMAPSCAVRISLDDIEAHISVFGIVDAVRVDGLALIFACRLGGHKLLLCLAWLALHSCAGRMELHA